MTALLFMRWEWSEGGAVTHFQIMKNLLSMLPSKFLILRSTNCKVIKMTFIKCFCRDMPTDSHHLTLPHTSPVLWFCHFKMPVILHHPASICFYIFYFLYHFLIFLWYEGKLYDAKCNRLSNPSTKGIYRITCMTQVY